MRMLMNNLDPDVAERPDDLVVYGGTGARRPGLALVPRDHPQVDHASDDETMLVQSGRPVGVMQTHEWAPRVMLANSNLVATGRPGPSSAGWRSSASPCTAR